MNNISHIRPNKTTWPKRIWKTTKWIAQKPYITAPAILCTLLYNPLKHLGMELPNIYPYAYLGGAYVSYKIAEINLVDKGINPNIARKSLRSTIIFGILGAKALLFAQFHDKINFSDVLLRNGGTWYGGALAGLATLYLYAKSAKISFLKLLDYITPAALIGLGIGRLGCWSAGCCQGDIFGIPTQPFSAAFNISIGFWLTRAAKNAYFKGKTFLLGTSSYALFRFTVEYFRNEPIVFGGLTLSQTISAGALMAFGILYVKLSKSNK